MTVAPVSSDLWSYGQVGRLALQAAALSSKQDTLQDQTATGLVATQVADLGDDTRNVLDLQPQIAALSALGRNADVASARLSTAATGLDAITSIGQSVSTGLLGLIGSSGDDLASKVSALAQSAQAQLASLGVVLNSKVGDTYVFSGSAATAPPIAAPAALVDGPLAGAVASQLAGLSSNSAASVLSGIIADTASTQPGSTPFNPDVATASPQSVMVGQGQAIVTGSSITAPGTLSATSTGSSVRDLVAVLTTVAGLGSVDTGQGEFSSLTAGLRSILGNALSGISALTGQNGVSQQVVATTSSAASALGDVLGSRVGTLTSVDLSVVSVELNQTNAQIQASFELIKDLGALNLAAFL